MPPPSALLVTLATCLVLLESVRPSVLHSRQGSAAHLVNDELGLAKLRLRNMQHIGDSSSNVGGRTRRSTSDEISLQNLDSIEGEDHTTPEFYSDANQEVKRRWNSGRNMAVWGKRDVMGDVIGEENPKWPGDNDLDEIKSKLRNEKIKIWEKYPHSNDFINAQKRKWYNGNRMELWGKRKWLSRNMAVWGKRGLNPAQPDETGREGIDAKRAWRGRDMAVWG